MDNSLPPDQEPVQPAAPVTPSPSPAQSTEPNIQPPRLTAPTPASAPRMAPPVQAPQPQAAPPKSGGNTWVWVTLVLFGVLGIAAVVGFIGFISNLGASASMTSTSRDQMLEVTVKDSLSDNKIVIIDIAGVISGAPLDATGKSMVDYVNDQLTRAGNDSRVKAVLLRVNSPGGEVMASDDIYKSIKEFQEEEGKPVVCVMRGMAASGGYYVAAPCQWIIASELTMTGSIGVIMQGMNFRGLMDKVGVEPLTFTSGEFKDMLSSYKKPSEITNEEKQIVQSFIDETFGRFKTVIRDGRAKAAERNDGEGNKLADDWESYADGRLLSGSQAFKHGFIDELGDFEDAVERTLAIAEISNAKLVKYQRPFGFGNIFSLFGKSPAKEATMKVDIGIDFPRLEVGRAYFLPASHAY